LSIENISLHYYPQSIFRLECLEERERRHQRKKLTLCKISFIGDSAGGNLVLAVLSHTLHPHPDITPISLPKGEKFKSAILISPWTEFSLGSKSHEQNKNKDYLSKETLYRWGSAFQGDAKADEYLWPATNTASWWDGLPVGKVLNIAGDDEVFRDDIVRLGRAMEVRKSFVCCL
jgi:acetyl esterase/lipase